MSDQSPIGRARRLRQNMTREEVKLWGWLRARRFHGYKFLRQHPIIYQVANNDPQFFIADFYCASKKLVIEVDGKIHDYQKEDDQHRDDILKGLGLRLLRIRNDELKDVVKVLDKIKSELDS